MRELENLIDFVVDDPHMFFGIVEADAHLMRAAAAGEEMIPLRPVFDHGAVRIDDDDAVLEARLALRRGNAKRAVAAGVAFGRFFGNRQFAALQQNDAIRIFGKDAALRTPSPARVPQRLRPAGDDLVGAGLVLAALFLSLGGSTPS